MIYTGSFVNEKGDTITLTVITNSDTSSTTNISEDNGLSFSAEETITTEVSQEDTFEPLLASTASIQLIADTYYPDLFSASVYDAALKVERNGTCVFLGFLTPQTYNQDFVSVIEDLQFNAVDLLAALQYANYRNVGCADVNYDSVKQEARTITFSEVLRTIFNNITAHIPDAFGSVPHLYYDGSKMLSSDDDGLIFDRISISELLFLEDEEDDCWSSETVLSELLRYLNLHIVQYGPDFYIFDWQTLRKGEDITWTDILTGGTTTTKVNTIAITEEATEDADTQISIGECYNIIKITDSVTSMDTLIESPLDDDSLTEPFGGMQKYCTEYISEGNGMTAYTAFDNMVHGKTTTYDGASRVDWFVNVKAANNWRFYSNGMDIYSKFCADGTNMQDILNYLSQENGACIVATGKNTVSYEQNDDSIVGSVTMDDNLVIAVNGNGKTDENQADLIGDIIKKGIPVAEYTGNTSGGAYSPSDSSITNYIVISGKMVLNPRMVMTGGYHTLYDNTDWEGTSYQGKWEGATVPSRNNTNGRYYTRKYWKAENRRDTPEYDDGPYYPGAKGIYVEGWCPYTESGPQWDEFTYSAIGDSTDKISKVGVLCCMLIIGNKCVVEKNYGEDLGTGVAGTGKGLPEDFVWRDYKTLDECESEDEYYQQSFTIGFNPKIGDKLIGTSFKIMNNAKYTYDVGKEGICIPIKMSDGISGQAQFKILGPCNVIWGEITRRHPTMFRHTKWTTDSIALMGQVSSIIMEEFKVELCTDNGGVSVTDDGDIVYMSDTATTFNNKKDDIEFKLTSALTAEESKALQVEAKIAMSTPINNLQNTGIVSIFDKVNGNTAKPEILYVEAYYNEYHKPRLMMEQNMQDRGEITPFTLFNHPALNKTFFPYGCEYDYMTGCCQLKLKETDND